MSIIKGTNKIVAGFGGTKENIGDVKWSYSKLATDNSGRLPLFTGETITSANTIYPEFYNWILAHTELQCTSEEYESALTTYGECAKYVIGSGSLRLPLIKNYIKAANTAEGIKNIEAGLPNIEGRVFQCEANYNVANGAFYNGGATSQKTSNGGGSGVYVDFDASRSSAVYGKSDTVTPASTTLYPWVVAYAAAIPASTAQAAEFQQGLSGKADTNLGNVPSNYDYVVDSYNDANGNWYRVYKSGWVEQGGRFVSNDKTDTIVTLLKPYANTTYSIMVGQMIGSSGDTTYWNFAVYNNTTSTVTIHDATNGAGNICQWEAKGMGAN